MKKFLLSAVVIAAMSFGAKAQKNTVLVGGDVNFHSDKTGDVKNNNFSFTPTIGYQFDDHWTTGGVFGIGTAKNSLDKKTNSFNAGPFVRYAQGLGNIFAVYGQLNTSFMSGKDFTNFATQTVSKYNGIGAKFFPAIGVNLKNNFALNFSFGGISYNSLKYKGASDRTNNFDFDFGTGATFGISKNF